MLIGVIADTHGDLGRAERCLALLPKVEIILHAGDLYEDGQRIAEATGMRVVGVRGNCDYMVKGPTEEMLAVAGKRIYITHGHLYKVKRDLGILTQRSLMLGADVTVFGHTHAADITKRDGILFVNPGSPHSPRSGAPSCAVLDVSRKGVKDRIYYLKPEPTRVTP